MWNTSLIFKKDQKCKKVHHFAEVMNCTSAFVVSVSCLLLGIVIGLLVAVNVNGLFGLLDVVTVRGGENPDIKVQEDRRPKSADSNETAWADSFRLPRSLVPEHYELFLHPDLEAGSFTGNLSTVSVKVNLLIIK